MFPQFGGGITQNPLVRGTVVKPPPLHVDQRNHVGGVFGDDLEQLFAMFRLPANAVHAELLVDHDKREGAKGDPIPLRHDLGEDLSSRKISAILSRKVSRWANRPTHNDKRPTTGDNVRMSTDDDKNRDTTVRRLNPYSGTQGYVHQYYFV